MKDKKKTQYDLIREDIDLIEKYYGTGNYDSLINDLLLHIKSAEIQYEKQEDKLKKIKEYCKNDNDYCGNDSYVNGLNQGCKETCESVLKIIEEGNKD